MQQCSNFSIQPYKSKLQPINTSIPNHQSREHSTRNRTPQQILSLTFNLCQMRHRRLPITRQRKKFNTKTIQYLPRTQARIQRLSFTLKPRPSKVQTKKMYHLFPRPSTQATRQLQTTFQVLIQQYRQQQQLMQQYKQRTRRQHRSLLQLQTNTPSSRQATTQDNSFQQRIHQRPLSQRQEKPNQASRLRRNGKRQQQATR